VILFSSSIAVGDGDRLFSKNVKIVLRSTQWKFKRKCKIVRIPATSSPVAVVNDSGAYARLTSVYMSFVDLQNMFPGRLGDDRASSYSTKPFAIIVAIAASASPVASSTFFLVMLCYPMNVFFDFSLFHAKQALNP